MDIEWHRDKAISNRARHGIGFEEAATALDDPRALVLEDAHAEGEMRYILLGMSTQLRLLIVVYTLRKGNTIRIISARKATKKEVTAYAQGI